MKFTKAKMWVAAVGGTLTGASAVVATLNVAFENNAVDAGEWGLIITALVTFAGTVRAVWATENKPVV